jgi:hypothetical protein
MSEKWSEREHTLEEAKAAIKEINDFAKDNNELAVAAIQTVTKAMTDQAITKSDVEQFLNSKVKAQETTTKEPVEKAVEQPKEEPGPFDAMIKAFEAPAVESLTLEEYNAKILKELTTK